MGATVSGSVLRIQTNVDSVMGVFVVVGIMLVTGLLGWVLL